MHEENEKELKGSGDAGVGRGDVVAVYIYHIIIETPVVLFCLVSF